MSVSKNSIWRLALSSVLATTILVFALVQLWPDIRPYSRGTQLPVGIVSTNDGTAQIGGPIPPIPITVATDPRKVKIGDRLFHDPILSIDETVSCASCHDLAKGGDDGRRTSRGVNNSIGFMNAPTVLNSGFNVAQFWDGRARTLEDQIDGPIQNPAEMGSNWPTVLGRLRLDETYSTAFRAIYDDGVQIANVKNVIAEFERSLITPNSRFDRFLRGDRDALTTEEREGYDLFTDLGCVSCHQGVNMGGNLFQRLGIVIDYFTGNDAVQQQHFGRFNVTGQEVDRFVFRVPSLRNVDLTAPYLHDGSVAELKTVVKIMAEYQLGRRLAPKEEDRIVAFLKTLTGERREASR